MAAFDGYKTCADLGPRSAWNRTRPSIPFVAHLALVRLSVDKRYCPPLKVERVCAEQCLRTRKVSRDAVCLIGPLDCGT